ncbi:MAG: hypothetical protein KDB61_09195, partial [Planctomycetes bacterium]|nr:hypothetical protein [Planctomycetota bacterium]
GNYHFSIPLPSDDSVGRPRALAVTPGGRVAVAFAQGGVMVLEDSGRVVRRPAGFGPEEGQVEDPCGLAIMPRDGAQPARLFVLDRYGDRVQVFSLEGGCYGAFPALVS